MNDAAVPPALTPLATPAIGILLPIMRAGDIMGNVISPATCIDAVYLAAAGNATYTIPSGCSVIRIRVSQTAWVNPNGPVAAAPTTNITNGTGSISVAQFQELFLSGLAAGAQIGIYLAATSAASIECFQ